MPNMMKPHILIVDDDKVATEALTHIFKKNGMKVTVTHEGAEAIAVLKKNRFDFVLLDIKLPLSEIDGWQVLHEIKSNPKISDIPVFVLSNAGMHREVQRGLELGADAYLLKAHTSIHEVVEQVQAVVGKK